ncbi:hypothetical protein TNCV_2864581 [Trichonephila clavipes]|nr:hypothetical protein TNCV_2864581 [Trichonephila clavipes]
MASQEFEPSTAEGLSCREVMHVKSRELKLPTADCNIRKQHGSSHHNGNSMETCQKSQVDIIFDDFATILVSS